MEWMRALRFEHAPQQVTMVDYLGEVDHAAARIERLEHPIDDAIAAAPPALRALIDGLQALRGVAKMTATTLAVEIGQFSRFDRPPKLMAYCGVVPSEDTTGKRRRPWGEHFIDKITVPEVDAWVRSLTADYGPETIRHHVGLFRRIVSKARGQYQLPPIDWDLITLPAVDDEHAMNNRLNAEQIAMVLPIVVDQYPFTRR